MLDGLAVDNRQESQNAIETNVIRWLRNLVYSSVLLAVLPWLLWRSYRTGRYRSGVRTRLLGLATSDFSSGEPNKKPIVIWLHGVSVGEVQLLGPLLRELQKRLPKASFAVSSSTDSGFELARRTLPKDTFVFYFPLDFSWSVERTLQTLQPTLIVLGELELWPNLIDAAKARSVPLVVVNGRLSQRSQAGYLKFSRFTKSMFSRLDLVCAQSEANAQRFRACGAANTIVTGSIKFDNVNTDANQCEVQTLRAAMGLQSAHRVWVMGSTQAGEEYGASLAYLKLRSEFPTLKLIVVPRHPDRFDAVFRELYGNFGDTGLQLVRRSRLNLPALSTGHSNSCSTIVGDDWDVCLVDSVGELKWWWGLAEIAVVGGSFGARGGQNMLEPCGYGANVAFGPNVSNFRDIVEILLSADAAVQLQRLEDLPGWLAGELRDPSPGLERGQRARQVIIQQQGALLATVDRIIELLPPG